MDVFCDSCFPDGICQFPISLDLVILNEPYRLMIGNRGVIELLEVPDA